MKTTETNNLEKNTSMTVKVVNNIGDKRKSCQEIDLQESLDYIPHSRSIPPPKKNIEKN